MLSQCEFQNEQRTHNQFLTPDDSQVCLPLCYHGVRLWMNKKPTIRSFYTGMIVERASHYAITVWDVELSHVSVLAGLDTWGGAGHSLSHHLSSLQYVLRETDGLWELTQVLLCSTTNSRCTRYTLGNSYVKIQVSLHWIIVVHWLIPIIFL